MGARAGNVDFGRWRVLDHDVRREGVGFGMLDACFVWCVAAQLIKCENYGCFGIS
jgi:hypothetical protein